jgi:hypothetical protein
MRFALWSAPLLLIGLGLIGCSKESGRKADSGPSPQPKVVDSSKPLAELKIPSMH